LSNLVFQIYKLRNYRQYLFSRIPWTPSRVDRELKGVDWISWNCDSHWIFITTAGEHILVSKFRSWNWYNKIAISHYSHKILHVIWNWACLYIH